MGTIGRITSTRTGALIEALSTARDHVAAVTRAASRFEADSEISRINAVALHTDVHTRVSPTLAELLRAAQHASQLTEGLVDPTVGPAVIAAGYDVDLAAVRARSLLPADEATDPATRVQPRPAPGWSSVRLDVDRLTLDLPRGTLLDLGAVGKAAAAHQLARILARRLPGGFLVELGGDIAVNGEPPATGWQIDVLDWRGRSRQTLRVRTQAMATSSTQQRTWIAAGRRQHHIIDPRSGAVATPVWGQVSCVGATAVEANAAATAAIVLGGAAPAWLSERGIASRLEPVEGATVFVCGWPDQERPAA